MRFDLFTIFPDYFAPLELSLLGKAQTGGFVSVNIHNLRDWATGKHLSVDDTVAGGGAGMVMRADVWGSALDTVFTLPVGDPSVDPASPNISDNDRTWRRVLAVPTPSGVPLTQRIIEDLATADQIVVACGRYEGIDSRVISHYGSRGEAVEGATLEVLEFSLGDYVLNGGEVAALALVEGVSRLLDGVIGNPESLVEESHSSEGLLEYPVFTQPRSWRELDIPEVLSSGNHAKIERWRRDMALRKTASRRPDMIWRLAARDRDDRGRPKGLDVQDLEVLANAGYVLVPNAHEVVFDTIHSGMDQAQKGAGYEEVAALAGATFVLACPPHMDQEAIDRFVAENLSAEALRINVEVQGARICVAKVAAPNPPWETRSACSKTFKVVGYTLTFPTAPDDLSAGNESSIYLSKCYTDAKFHGSGVSGALLEFALADAERVWGQQKVVLGTNVKNKRASRFYRNHGFKKSGSRRFNVGGRLEHDDVFVRDLTSYL